jgi:hypothetical protein
VTGFFAFLQQQKFELLLKKACTLRNPLNWWHKEKGLKREREVFVLHFYSTQNWTNPVSRCKADCVHFHQCFNIHTSIQHSLSISNWLSLKGTWCVYKTILVATSKHQLLVIIVFFLRIVMWSSV